ncbi:outer membrane protein [Yoonia sp. I 8.24]|uniref:outer membrane protein n=1 Tax=Yoonia sp. I 8.24 TaxID=1537229 RepID=UPI001EDF4F73|nr:hypothetical protein [Yoonia sp. I 8.24]MCG3267172.1 porin family protein [Yoonia sp. I 8.24]
MNYKFLFTSSLIAFGQMASAGGITVPVIEAPVIAPTAPVADWSGSYVGADLGFGSGTYGNDTAGFPGDGEDDLSGGIFGISLGHNFQSGSWVYGAELQYFGSTIEGTDDCGNPSYECALEVNALYSLRGQAGYVLNSGMLIKGNVGIAGADTFGFVDNGSGEQGSDVTLSGVTFGVAIEKSINEHLSWEAGVQHYAFDAEDYLTDSVYPDVETNITTAEMGLNYRF